MDCFLVIPCLNESSRLPSFLHKLCEEIARSDLSVCVQVVDDGSGSIEVERLRKVVRRCRNKYPFVAEVYAMREHLGKGAAIRSGLALAPDSVGLLGFVDADGSVSGVESLRVMKEALQAERPCLVIASRAVDGAVVKRSFLRRVIARGFSALVRSRYEIEIMDTQCGCKFLDASWYQKHRLGFAENGFAWDLELVLEARAKGCCVREVGISWFEVAGSRLRSSDILRLGISVFRRRIGQ